VATSPATTNGGLTAGKFELYKDTTGNFELYKDAAGKFRFRLKASYGEVIAVVEGYESKASAVNGIDSVNATLLKPPSTTRPTDPLSLARLPESWTRPTQ
jgi:uncharacterized protein